MSSEYSRKSGAHARFNRHAWLPVGALLVMSCAAEEPASPRAHEDEAEIGTTSQAFRSFTSPGISGPDHDDITHFGLTFLDDDVVNDLGNANEGCDSPLSSLRTLSEYHTDNCRIGQSFDRIRSEYAEAVAAANPNAADLDRVILKFGRILHTIQDFYAHSDWVEAGQTELFSENEFAFPDASPGATLGGMYVLGTGMPRSWFVDRPSNTRVPLVWDGSGRPHQGLITGTYDNTDKSICPAEASIPHGADFNQGDDENAYLAKDDPDSPHHGEAVGFAVVQTKEEFCRLVRLVALRYGDAGRDYLLNHWLDNRAEYAQACMANDGLVASVRMAGAFGS